MDDALSRIIGFRRYLLEQLTFIHPPRDTVESIKANETGHREPEESMPERWTRRGLIGGALGGLLLARSGQGSAQVATGAWSYPIAWDGGVLGDGFVIRHGFATENTWYNPGWWHCAEDWYALDGAETGGAGIYAIGDGEVVFVGSDYPGRVVIVRHREALYSMYGHLDYQVPVNQGDTVSRGQSLGTVLVRTDGRVPSHLHFETRTFLTSTEVNGSTPRYNVNCGVNCAPGPGYWPISAPEHPVALGWRNPTHMIHTLADEPPTGEVVVAAGAGGPIPRWSAPADHDDAEPLEPLDLAPGDRLAWRSVATRDPARDVTSADGYRLWYRVETLAGERGWVQAALPSSADTGSDGRPSTVRLVLLPAIAAGS
jgi:murein DD-endopeptidase MepM/ murein hydrolase activator NlpD